jgi:methylated-DNA-[protein]-cysteine S-methyltransferase
MDDGILRSTLPTPHGTLQLAVDADGFLVELLLPNRKLKTSRNGDFTAAARRTIKAAERQLDEYFARRRREFDLPLRPAGSPFEQRVWERLCGIPYGSTTSYGAIAHELGLVNGARAVGRANGSNPIAIIIPCHRVIGSDGTLTGYGGGLPLKTALLELEGALRNQQVALFGV